VTLSNVKTHNFGFFILVITLAFSTSGWSQTQPHLTVQISGGYALINISGDIGSAWTIQFRDDLTPTNFWLPLKNVTLSNSPLVVTDTTQPATSQQRFYRAVSYQPPNPSVVVSNMAWMPPGTFLMGSPTNEVGRGSDEILHEVTLTHGFYIGNDLVMQGDFLSVEGINPSYFNGIQGTNDYGTDLTRPVEMVYQSVAADYCAKVTIREQQAGRLPANWVYRLPTEAEWEYACRSGTTNRFSYGDDPGYMTLVNYAWYAANSGSMTQPVAQKLPNPSGMYDVHGNVYEWCQDFYGAYPAGPVVDPQGPIGGSDVVFRGGAWSSSSGKFCRSAGRYSANQSYRDNTIGFRVVVGPSGP
jgi:formylglycine-generating enzyme required for sulfatase activity